MSRGYRDDPLENFKQEIEESLLKIISLDPNVKFCRKWWIGPTSDSICALEAFYEVSNNDLLSNKIATTKKDRIEFIKSRLNVRENEIEAFCDGWDGEYPEVTSNRFYMLGRELSRKYIK